MDTPVLKVIQHLLQTLQALCYYNQNLMDTPVLKVIQHLLQTLQALSYYNRNL